MQQLDPRVRSETMRFVREQNDMIVHAVYALAELREWVRASTLSWSRSEQALGTDPSVVEAERKRAVALLDKIERVIGKP
jgi:hypothetical protein